MSDEFNRDSEIAPATDLTTKPEPAQAELVKAAPRSPAVQPEPERVFVPPPGHQQPYQAQGYQQTMANQPASNGMATSGGVLGIVGFVLGWIPFAGIFIGFVLGILAIVFSSIGLSRAGKLPNQVGKGMAITGLVLGILIVIFKLIPGVNLL
jgi:hypothetical protein